MREARSLSLSLLCSVFIFSLTMSVWATVQASPGTIYVPDNYPTIQAAVDAASPGDTVIVRDGTYIENVDISTDNLTIQSENGAEVTIVQAANLDDHVFEVAADYLTVTGFTITGATHSPPPDPLTPPAKYAGVYLSSSQYCTILYNRLVESDRGIWLLSSSNNGIHQNITINNEYEDVYLQSSVENHVTNNQGSIRLESSERNHIEDNNGGRVRFWSSRGNDVLNNTFTGIEFWYSHDNTFSWNTFSNILFLDCSLTAPPDYGSCSNNNLFYLNNLPYPNYAYSPNTWHSPEQTTYTYSGNIYTSYLGNYWSDYTGVDVDGDGIGDTSYSIDGDSDNYPLMKPFENYGIAPDVTPVIDHIIISPKIAYINVGSIQAYTAEAFDQYGTSMANVTANTTFSIQSGAGGNWSTNIYTSEKVGDWTVTGTYNGKSDNATLIVSSPTFPPYIFSTTGTIIEVQSDRIIVQGSGTNFSDRIPRTLTVIFTDLTTTFDPASGACQHLKRYLGMEGLAQLVPGMRLLISTAENIRNRTEFTVSGINTLRYPEFFITDGTITQVEDDRILVQGDGSNFTDGQPRLLTVVFTDSTFTIKRELDYSTYEGLSGLEQLVQGMKIRIVGQENIKDKTEFAAKYVNIFPPNGLLNCLAPPITYTTGTISDVQSDRIIVQDSDLNFADRIPRTVTMIFTDSTTTFEPGQQVRYKGLDGLTYLKPGWRILIDSVENILGKTEFTVKTVFVRGFGPPPSDTTPPDTQITSGPGGTIESGNVTFAYTGSDDVSPSSQLLYSYILEPYDSDWSAWTDNTTKQYFSLPDGDYTFKVKAKDKAGNMDSSPASSSFLVNRRPAASFSLLNSSWSGSWQATVSETVTFDGSASIPSDGATEIVLYQWRIDGALLPIVKFGESIEHTYYANILPEGQNEVQVGVTLTVADDQGRSANTTQTITVKRPPVLLAHGIQLDIFPGWSGFDLDDIWFEMTRCLTGRDLSDSAHFEWVSDNDSHRIKRVEGSGFVVYVSNYTHDPSQPTKESILEYAANLGEEIEMIKRREHVSKVDVVAHSMGGLVSRAYIEVDDFDDNPSLAAGFEYGGDVRKLVMLATPNQGASFARLADDDIELPPQLPFDILAFILWLSSIDDYESVEQLNPLSDFIHELDKDETDGGFSGSALGVDYSTAVGNGYRTGAFFEHLLGEFLDKRWPGQENDGLVTIVDAYLEEIPRSRFAGPLPYSHSQLRGNHDDRGNKGKEHIIDFMGDLVKDILLDPIFNEGGVRVPDTYVSALASPGELRVYDSVGRVTGLVDGVVLEEIPNSSFDPEGNVVLILPATDYYYSQVVGTGGGQYGLDIYDIRDRQGVVFSAIGIQIASGGVHQYTIDGDALARGENGATIEVDADGNGTFEHTVIADDELTVDEFILQTATIVDFDPDTLHLKSKGEFVTVYIELPTDYDVNEIDVFSVKLNGVVPALDKPTEIGDYDGDGVPDLMVKFDRATIQDILDVGEQVEITVSGEVGGIAFGGSDTIRIIE